MKIGTRSLLFGVHQFLLHPVFVAIAWYKLYGMPRIFPHGFMYLVKLIVCFVVHDWGYWGKSEMDGPEGDKHPELGARIVHKLFDHKDYLVGFPCSAILDNGWKQCPGSWDESEPSNWYKESQEWYNFCLCHSRFYAKQLGMQPSRLCMADKLAMCYYPDWLYLMLARMSGELKEYMRSAQSDGKHGHMALDTATPLQWLRSTKAYMLNYAVEHKDGKPDTVTTLVTAPPSAPFCFSCQAYHPKEQPCISSIGRGA